MTSRPDVLAKHAWERTTLLFAYKTAHPDVSSTEAEEHIKELRQNIEDNECTKLLRITQICTQSGRAPCTDLYKALLKCAAGEEEAEEE